ncbi:MAG: type II secretion system protein GspD [Alphaproteobacteria bacterium]
MFASGRFGRFGGFIVTVLAVVFLTSCQAAKNQLQFDRSAELDRQDYRDALAPNTLPPDSEVPTPEFQAVLSTPEELRLPSPLVSVQVNQTVGLRDLIWQLAEQADIDVELDPQIHGTISFTAKERPFDEVIQRICDMAGLRYKFDNAVLRVELDRPYTHNYSVDFINVARRGSMGINTSISLASTEGGAAGSGSSSSNVSNEINGDMWKELNDGMEQLLSSSDTYISLATLTDPVTAPAVPAPPPPPANPDQPPPPPPLPGDPAVAPLPAAVAPVLNITTPPGEPMVPNPPATFSISRQSGIVSVFASERQQRLVQRFMNDFRRRVGTQVLIEAKVLQVELNDEYAAGINWSDVDLTGLLKVTQGYTFPGITGLNGSNFGLTFDHGNFSAALQAMNRFGSIRILSSPRVTVMNNQPAVVNVTQSFVYFDFDVEAGTTDTNGVTTPPTIDGEVRSVPEGVLLNVVPTANPDTGEIVLVVRPTVSKITNTIPDPTVGLTLALNGGVPPGVEVPTNEIPRVALQEIDSVMRLQSGQMMALGGLMEDENTIQQDGVPIASDMPILGALFRTHKDTLRKSELVIFLKASIIAGSNVDEMEKKTYKVFSLDRRPARL